DPAQGRTGQIPRADLPARTAEGRYRPGDRRTDPRQRERRGHARRRRSELKERTMPTYKAPVEDVLFLLNDVFHVERYNNLPGFAEAPADVIEAVLGEAAKLCEQVLQPLNRVGDEDGCTRRPDGSGTTPKGFKEADRQ